MITAIRQQKQRGKPLQMTQFANTSTVDCTYSEKRDVRPTNAPGAIALIEFVLIWLRESAGELEMIVQIQF